MPRLHLRLEKAARLEYLTLHLVNYDQLEQGKEEVKSTICALLWVFLQTFQISHKEVSTQTTYAVVLAFFTEFPSLGSVFGAVILLTKTRKKKKIIPTVFTSCKLKDKFSFLIPETL